MSVPIDSAELVLVVASDRDDRRLLFDALDAEGFATLHVVADPAQARVVLDTGVTIAFAVVEFRDEATDALALCAELRRHAGGAAVPVVGLRLGAGAGSAAEVDGVVGWIDSPVDVLRLRGVLDAAAIVLPRRSPRGADIHSPDRYQFAFDGSLDELAVVDPASGLIVDVNTTFVQRSGHARVQLIGARIDQFDAVLSPERRADVQLTLAREGSVQHRGRKPRADGSSYAVDVHVRLAVQDGRLVHFYLFRELSELVRYQQALAALGRLARSGAGESGYKATVRAVVDWLSLDFAALLAAPSDAGGEPQVLDIHHRLGLGDPRADPLAEAATRRVLAGSEILHSSGAWRSAAADGFVRERRFECFVGIPLVGERQTCVGALLVARRDVLAADGAAIDGLRVIAHALALDLELRAAREQGRAIGLQDPLTGLPNRLLFNDRLNSAIQEAHRTSEMFAVIFVDLDRFKNVNDSLRHAVGDQDLVAVSKRLRNSVRASDTVARYAGDEFTLILRHVAQREHVTRVAEKIVRAMESPLTLAGGLELGITASLGVSFYPDDATDAEHLLKHADVAMYSAKGLGRNNVQAYVAVPEESHQQRLALETKLRQAERNGELRVFYQPQLDGRSEDIVGMEALIRWEHPELGMISPGFFIPLAEESGLIIAIGEWVLRAACRDAQRWQARFGLPLRIGVNLSPLQLRQSGLVELVAAVLEETGLDPRLLDLEVTESVSMKSIPNLLETLHDLRELGCGISIDDFGTGQSSLDYIKRFPADRIKIDQAFVRNIGIDPDDEAIVQATIAMAHNLNREVVAEGVEVEQHLDFLREQRCDVLQGFLFCRPLPASAFESLLLERERVLAAMATSPPASASRARSRGSARRSRCCARSTRRKTPPTGCPIGPGIRRSATCGSRRSGSRSGVGRPTHRQCWWWCRRSPGSSPRR